MNKIPDIPNSLPAEAFFGIVNTEVLVWDAVQGALQEAGLPVGVGRLIPLMYLAMRPMGLRELTECTRAKESAASRLVERMVRDGLVSKERDACDRRAVMLRITPEGRRVEAAGREVFSRCLADVFGGLDDDELRTLSSLLARLAVPEAEAEAPAKAAPAKSAAETEAGA